MGVNEIPDAVAKTPAQRGVAAIAYLYSVTHGETSEVQVRAM